MDEVVLRFQKPGMNTLVQDGGRNGYQKYGVPVGGFMDSMAARVANVLTGNEQDASLFEITMIGPEIMVEGPCQFAITGGDLSPSLNGREIPMYETINIESKATLTFGKLKSGCRSYLAFHGDLKLKDWLGSSSATSFDTLELTPDSLIQKNSVIRLSPGKGIEPRRMNPIQYSSKEKVRILPGPEYNNFEGDHLHFFLNQEFTISKDSNRMGYRLDEAIPGFTNEKEVISSPIIPGTIQVTNSAQPIILMADAQTSGGYPRIANVISADQSKVAQFKPGDKVSFKLITLDEAVEIMKQSESYFLSN